VDLTRSTPVSGAWAGAWARGVPNAVDVIRTVLTSQRVGVQTSRRMTRIMSHPRFLPSGLQLRRGTRFVSIHQRRQEQLRQLHATEYQEGEHHQPDQNLREPKSEVEIFNHVIPLSVEIQRFMDQGFKDQGLRISDE
jgi:hypothetical protein